MQVNIGVILYEFGGRGEARQRWRKVLNMGDPVMATLAGENLQRSP